MAEGGIRVGIGGWTYEPWRGTFYPAGLPQARELAYAAGRLTAIEINGTFYSSQKPATFAKWRDAAPAGFVYSLKAARFCTQRKDLSQSGESIEKFLGQGLTELGDRLGPILWQLPATKRFEPDQIAAFLALLPAARDGVRLRHAIEPRHETFDDPAFFALARAAGVAVVFADSPRYPCFAEQTGAFSYARLQDAREDCLTGYDAAALDGWEAQARAWAADGRDVFMFFINGAKVRAPAAAEALIARLRRGGEGDIARA
ncbi:DUF72 domain-containing protein [Novosphingobium album (ex Liu et al. 2023)]|uniref:DUF72 domain-containing protein n=1 Tax=Novosphingobium album (ex Liu et al. 2023) TaxID=3031130 RepID=A0ABT5WJN0_9SPHN|nr:DUF72 domain-containing protein [Novosphingobium album (ex Liu et al. 2023)]MDE8650254.1 DUF72 domain-containing protein [Novosphingobium album (ex Liu et al. 2023)]